MNIIINNRLNLRRSNRKGFIEKIEWSKKSNFCILILLYNNVNNVQWMINYLNSESKRDNIDLIIVDNSINQQYDYLDSCLCNMTYLRPTKNLWSAWGYAIGMEYIIEQWYEYFTMLEDDIILIDWEVFSETYSHCAKNQLIFMNACINAWWEQSWYVQYACYPVSFIEKVWIIDPRYFFRSEDLERKIRIEQWIQMYNYHKFILNKNHYHPYLKRVNGSASWSYFSIRNQFLMFQKHLSFETCYVLFTLYFYIWNSLVRTVIFLQYQYINAWYYAILDFICWCDSFNNHLRLRQLSESYTIGKWSTKIRLSDFLDFERHSSLIFGTRMFSKVDNEKLSNLMKPYWSIFFNGVLIGWWTTVVLPLFLISPKIISIDEFILWTDEFYYTTYLNKFNFLKFFIVIILGVLSLFVYMLVIFILLFKIIFIRILFRSYVY